MCGIHPISGCSIESGTSTAFGAPARSRLHLHSWRKTSPDTSWSTSMASPWFARVAVASAIVAAATIYGASDTLADPAGNNGTMKINAQGIDSSEDISHEPHVPCDFQVEFFGFDEMQTATITFTIHSPSGDGEVLLSEPKTVSFDKAGGGLNDVDEVFPYSGSTFGLENFTAQPQQGFHIRLTVTSEGVPGGVKHKMFWLQCGPASTPPSSPASTPPSSPPSTPPSSPASTPPSSPSSTPPSSPSQSASTSQPPSTSAPASTSPAAGQLPVTGAGLGGLVAAG